MLGVQRHNNRSLRRSGMIMTFNLCMIALYKNTNVPNPFNRPWTGA
jgi:hypothetical protein